MRSQIASPTKFLKLPEQQASNFPQPNQQGFKVPEPVIPRSEVRSSRSKSTLDNPHNAVHLSNHSPKQQRVNHGKTLAGSDEGIYC